MANKLLNESFSDVFSFEVPKGGMAVWITLDKKYSWKRLTKIALKHQLEIGEWQRYDKAKIGHNSIRIGYASYNEEEIIELMKRFRKIFNEIKS